MLLFAAGLASLSAPAAAIVVPVDLSAPGDALISRDLDTGLDWLDPGVTGGSTFDEVIGNATGPGIAHDEGFRHATVSEFNGLLRAFGVPVPRDAPGATTIAWLAPGLALQDLVGVSDARTPTSRSIVGYLLTDDGAQFLRARVTVYLLAGFIGVEFSADYSQFGPNFSKLGNWLVRDTSSAPNAVPVPATLSLAALGIFGCRGRRGDRRA
ncbi:MAG: hypothetical protein H6983_06100 [Ectothiorhodospiraceae bacterium]|nr:hypothetical protein [Ectothiorhodospiraceae bacterium]